MSGTYYFLFLFVWTKSYPLFTANTEGTNPLVLFALEYNALPCQLPALSLTGPNALQKRPVTKHYLRSFPWSSVMFTSYLAVVGPETVLVSKHIPGAYT